MLYVSEDEASDEECSPTPAKRGKKSSPRSQSHPLPHGSAAAPHPAAGQPLMGDFLATILTDIPEVDICSLSSLSTNSPSTSQRDTRLAQSFIGISFGRGGQRQLTLRNTLCNALLPPPPPKPASQKLWMLMYIALFHFIIH